MRTLHYHLVWPDGSPVDSLQGYVAGRRAPNCVRVYPPPKRPALGASLFGQERPSTRWAGDRARLL